MDGPRSGPPGPRGPAGTFFGPALPQFWSWPARGACQTIACLCCPETTPTPAGRKDTLVLRGARRAYGNYFRLQWTCTIAAPLSRVGGGGGLLWVISTGGYRGPMRRPEVFHPDLRKKWRPSSAPLACDFARSDCHSTHFNLCVWCENLQKSTWTWITTLL